MMDSSVLLPGPMALTMAAVSLWRQTEINIRKMSSVPVGPSPT